MGRPAIDLTGRRFGKLVVLRRDFSKSGANVAARWFVRCDDQDCGKEYVVSSAPLLRRRKGQKSCGHDNKRATRHGHAAHNGKMSGAYKSWSSMIQRRTNPKTIGWKRYGGAGVKVHRSWRSFENFFAYMGVRPPGMTLDRYPKSNGNYEPGNVRWATPLQQARNKTTSRLSLDAAMEILRRIEAGEARKEVARVFGLRTKHVDALWRGHIWKEIERPWLREDRPRLQISKRQLLALAELDETKWYLPRELGAGRASFLSATLKQLVVRGLVEVRSRYGHYGKTGDEYRLLRSGGKLLERRGIDADAIKIERAVNLTRKADWFRSPLARRVLEALRRKLP
jgi:hypothetical protein